MYFHNYTDTGTSTSTGILTFESTNRFIEYEKKYTQGQIASLISKGMLNFFEETDIGY